MDKIISLWDAIPIYHFDHARTHSIDNTPDDFQMDDFLIKEIASEVLNLSQYYSYSTDTKPAPISTTKDSSSYTRSKHEAIIALGIAHFACEIDKSHITFIRRYDHLPYTEPHHLIPIAFQNRFTNSIDVAENIISLCSHCHNEIHYGENAKEMITKLYYARKDLLKVKGIDISLDELLSYYGV